MTSPDVSDEVLLAGHDAASFALFYRRHVDVMAASRSSSSR